MSIQNITDDSFDEKVLKNSKPVCLRFTANWCGDWPLVFNRRGGKLGPCKALAPIVEEISNEMEEIDFGVMDIDEQPNTPTKFGVRGIPTCIFVVNGEVKSTKVGMTSKSDFVAWLKENL